MKCVTASITIRLNSIVRLWTLISLCRLFHQRQNKTWRAKSGKSWDSILLTNTIIFFILFMYISLVARKLFLKHNEIYCVAKTFFTWLLIYYGKSVVSGRASQKYILPAQLIYFTYTSTLSTLTPQGSVASSSVDCIMLAMPSRSDRISPRFFVPRTFLKRRNQGWTIR